MLRRVVWHLLTDVSDYTAQHPTRQLPSIFYLTLSDWQFVDTLFGFSPGTRLRNGRNTKQTVLSVAVLTAAELEATLA
jgi:hypothetical protein